MFSWHRSVSGTLCFEHALYSFLVCCASILECFTTKKDSSPTEFLRFIGISSELTSANKFGQPLDIPKFPVGIAVRQDQSGRNVLCAASDLGLPPMVRLLLDHCAKDPIEGRSADLFGRTAVYAAAERGNKQVLEMLLQAECNLKDCGKCQVMGSDGWIQWLCFLLIIFTRVQAYYVILTTALDVPPSCWRSGFCDQI